MSKTGGHGRLCNQVVRNLAMSIIAQKFDLYVKYTSYRLICHSLGIPLYCGERQFETTVHLTCQNYFDILDSADIDYNLDGSTDYFQTTSIIKLIYQELRTDKCIHRVTRHNPFKSRYRNNNDVFIHVRLGDASKWNPGLEYYLQTLTSIETRDKIDNIYVASDEPSHELITQFKENEPRANLVNLDQIKTIQFVSTC